MLTKYELSGDYTKFEKAMTYLDENRKSFGILIDFQKIKVQALLTLKNVLKDDVSTLDWFAMIFKELL